MLIVDPKELGRPFLIWYRLDDDEAEQKPTPDLQLCLLCLFVLFIILKRHLDKLCGLAHKKS